MAFGALSTRNRQHVTPEVKAEGPAIYILQTFPPSLRLSTSIVMFRLREYSIFGKELQSRSRVKNSEADLLYPFGRIFVLGWMRLRGENGARPTGELDHMICQKK